MPALGVPPVGDPEESDDTEEDLNDRAHYRKQLTPLITCYVRHAAWVRAFRISGIIRQCVFLLWKRNKKNLRPSVSNNSMNEEM